MFNLQGKRALVTGGGRGIGKGIAIKLKEQGADVVISGSNEAKLKEVANEYGFDYVTANLMDNDAIDAMVENVGVVDILVNNAGITADNILQKLKDEDWDSVLQVNMRAVIRLTQKLLPAMSKKRFGRVINMSSVVAHMGNVGQANYITAKSAVTGFTKAVSGEVARRGITVNCIAPGFIETDMTDKLGDDVRKAYEAKIPARKFGSTDDIAAAVVYLASEEAGYVTGTTLHVNGGLYV